MDVQCEHCSVWFNARVQSGLGAASVWCVTCHRRTVAGNMTAVSEPAPKLKVGDRVSVTSLLGLDREALALRVQGTTMPPSLDVGDTLPGSPLAEQEEDPTVLTPPPAHWHGDIEADEEPATLYDRVLWNPVQEDPHTDPFNPRAPSAKYRALLRPPRVPVGLYEAAAEEAESEASIARAFDSLRASALDADTGPSARARGESGAGTVYASMGGLWFASAVLAVVVVGATALPHRQPTSIASATRSSLVVSADPDVLTSTSPSAEWTEVTTSLPAPERAVPPRLPSAGLGAGLADGHSTWRPGAKPDSELLSAEGDAAMARSDYGSALGIFERVVTLNPDFLPAWLSLADIRWLEGERAEAREGYLYIKATFPADLLPARVMDRTRSPLRM